jgi:glycosyl hydrolase family 10
VVATLIVGCLVGACVVVSASGATGAPGKASAPAGFYGVVPSTTLTAGDFKRMHKAGVGSIRLGFAWPTLQPNRGGGFDFSQTDNAVSLAAANNIKILAILGGTPSWESGGCTDKDCYNHIKLNKGKEKAAWKAYVQAVVQRYAPGGTFWQGSSGTIPGGITDWQIWNEQNNPNEKNSAKTYVQLVKLSNRVIKATDPTATIVTGGMFGEPRGGKKSTAWGYLKQLYSNGIGGKIDAVALHPYAVKPGGIVPQIQNIRDELKAAHHSKVETLVTEIAWGSSKKKHPDTGGRGRAFQVGIKKQKQNLTASFKLLTSHRKEWNIGGVYWFGWKDPPNNAPAGLCAFCYSSGLYKSNGTTAKPALGAFKAFTK